MKKILRFSCIVEKDVEIAGIDEKDLEFTVMSEFERFEDDPIGMNHKTLTKYQIIEDGVESDWKEC